MLASGTAIRLPSALTQQRAFLRPRLSLVITTSTMRPRGRSPRPSRPSIAIRLTKT